MRSTLKVLLYLGCLCGASVRADDTAEFFNGKNLDGWEGLMEYWKVENGAIVGGSDKPIPFNTFLCTKNKYGDFELSFQVRLKDGKGNSGVQVRSQVVDRERFTVSGPQPDIGGNYWGSVYGERFTRDGTVGGGHMMKAASADLVKKVLKPDDFNDYVIRCVGKRVTIKLNGETTVDEEFPYMPDTGIIALQVHSGGPMEVAFRNIKFKDLSKK